MAVVVVWLASAVFAQAEDAPFQEPILRIEAGMHTDIIRRIDVSADGKLLVTASADKTVRLWSLPEGKLLRTFRMPTGRWQGGDVYSVAISPDGRLVAVGGWDARNDTANGGYSIHVFEAVSGSLATRLGPLPSAVTSLAFARDGARLAAGLGEKGGLRVWTVPFGPPPLEDHDPGDSVYGLAFDQSGRLAVVANDGYLRIYDPRLALVAKVKTPVGTQPFSAAFTPDGEHLAVGYLDVAHVDVFLAKTLAHAFSTDMSGVSAVAGNLRNVAWSRDGRHLFAAGQFEDIGSHPILAWDDRGRGARMSFRGPIGAITDLRTLPDRDVVYASSDPGFGTVAPHLQSAAKLWRGPVTADMRGKTRGLLLSSDASQVIFGLGFADTDPWAFDFTTLSFDPVTSPRADLHGTETAGLPIANWLNESQPMLGGAALKLEPFEISRSVAIMPDARSFILGTDWALRRYDAKGELLWRAPTAGPVFGINLSKDGTIAVAALGDGMLRWYRTSDGLEFLSLFVNSQNKDWVAWTPSGYHAASPGGQDLIGWQVNGKSWDDAPDFFPASRFRDRYYRPDIVKMAFRAHDEAQAIKMLQPAGDAITKFLPPVVQLIAESNSIETDHRDVTLSIRVRSPSMKPISKIEAFVDGRPVEVDLPDLALDVVHSFTIPVPPRDSEVSVIATSGDLSSEPANISIIWRGARDILKPNLYAVLVGVGDYHNFEKLRFASTDAGDLAEALKAQAGHLYSKVSVTALTDRNASRANILDALERLENEVTARDVAIVYLAGHGMTDERQRFFFLPADADPMKLRATGISDAVLEEIFSSLAGRAILFLDACEGSGSNGPDTTSIVNQLGQPETGALVYSCFGDRGPVATGNIRNGAFAGAILEALSGGADYLKDGRLTASELGMWLNDRVRMASEGWQTVVMAMPSTLPDFPLAVPVRSVLFQGIPPLPSGEILQPKLCSNARGATSLDTGLKIEIINPRLQPGTFDATAQDEVVPLTVCVENAPDLKRLAVNQEVVELDKSGRFTLNVRLKPGANLFRLTGVDKDYDFQFQDIVINYDKSLADVSGSGKRYLLVMAIKDYDNDSMDGLGNPINDGLAVKDLLTQEYGFTTDVNWKGDPKSLVLTNPSKHEIEDAFLALDDILQPEDSLLIYYAGHGKVKDETGYWIPRDAQPEKDLTWYGAPALAFTLKSLDARSILVVSDSCFSGTMDNAVSRELSDPDESPRDRIAKKMQAKSRRLMSSGGNEPVYDGNCKEDKDHSVFACAFLRALRETKERWFTSQDLEAPIGEFVGDRADQDPKNKKILNAGDNDGDFVFVRTRLQTADSRQR